MPGDRLVSCTARLISEVAKKRSVSILYGTCGLAVRPLVSRMLILLGQKNMLAAKTWFVFGVSCEGAPGFPLRPGRLLQPAA